MDEIRCVQAQFLEELDNRSRVLSEIGEMRSGTSHAFNDVLSRFNNSVRVFIQTMLDQLQSSVAENKIMSESIDNTNRNADIYRESFNVLAAGTERLRRQFVDLYNKTATLADFSNQTLRAMHQSEQRARCLEAKVKKLEEANAVMKKREAALFTVMHKGMSDSQVIANSYNVFDQLAKKMADGVAATAEIGKLREQIASLAGENQKMKEENENAINEKDARIVELEAMCELQEGRIQELGMRLAQNPEAEKNEEEIQKLRDDRAKFLDAAKRWKDKFEQEKKESSALTEEIAQIREQLQKKEEDIQEKKEELERLAEAHETELAALRELYSAQMNPDDGENRHSHHDSPEVEEPRIDEDPIIHDDEGDGGEEEEEEEHKDM